MGATFDEFWTLYVSRLDSGKRHVRREDLAADPIVASLCDWPLSRLAATAPDRLSRCAVPLRGQLQEWLRALKANDAIPQQPVWTARPRPHYLQAHTLAYWNRSGPNGGLRRYG